jgi:trehalose 6-phosphate phosphatase
MSGSPKQNPSERAFDAAVFDLDGVVTFTARAHAAAWKELFDDYLRGRAARFGETFRPFDRETDYREYVDGRPRYDGVRAFLASRGISLPYGDPSDPPGRETVCGLGNRKNLLFQAVLRREGVDVDREAVRFIRDLRSRGIRVGMASSSKNATLILRTAGLLDLFDARVDGHTSERLGLRGKPAPDIFLECLERLAAPDPGRSLLAEDAVAGVQAGRAGAFGLVLGVDRGGRAVSLREHGADWIIRSFREISPDQVEAYFQNRAHARPNAIARWVELASALRGRRLAIFLGYEGVLVAATPQPEPPPLAGEPREALRRLAAAWPTTIVSERPVAALTAAVGVPEVNYAGGDGFEPARQRAPDRRPGVASGAHPRGAGTKESPRRAALPSGLAIASDRDRGVMLLRLFEALGLDDPETIPVYLGAEPADEAAFRSIEDRGIGILVATLPRPTAARYSLQDPGEVREVLDRLAALPGPG